MAKRTQSWAQKVAAMKRSQKKIDAATKALKGALVALVAARRELSDIIAEGPPGGVQKGNTHPNP